MCPEVMLVVETIVVGIVVVSFCNYFTALRVHVQVSRYVDVMIVVPADCDPQLYYLSDCTTKQAAANALLPHMIGCLCSYTFCFFVPEGTGEGAAKLSQTRSAVKDQGRCAHPLPRLGKAL